VPPVWSIRDRATFRALGHPAGRGALGPIKVSYVPAGSGAPSVTRVAYAVSRRTGNAVARNRLRRRLRAAMAGSPEPLTPGAYLVTPAPAAAGLAYEELARSVTGAMVAAAHAAAHAATRAAAPAGEAVR
jgi:ribonuclease P protein component